MILKTVNIIVLFADIKIYTCVYAFHVFPSINSDDVWDHKHLSFFLKWQFVTCGDNKHTAPPTSVRKMMTVICTRAEQSITVCGTRW